MYLVYQTHDESYWTTKERASVILPRTTYNGRVHAGFDHANMSQTSEHRLPYSDDDTLSVITG
jgi:hypothetical protein